MFRMVSGTQELAVAQDHTAKEWQRWGSQSGRLAPESLICDSESIPNFCLHLHSSPVQIHLKLVIWVKRCFSKY